MPHGSASTQRRDRRFLGVLALTVAGLAAVYLAPFVVDTYALVLLTSFTTAAIAIAGLNILFGYAGQISIGHAAFLGVGAYTAAILVDRYGWPYPLAILVAMALAFVLGYLLSIPALRLAGLYLALLTLAIGVVFTCVVRRLSDLTNGDRGMFGVEWDPPAWTGLYGFEGQTIWVFWVSGLCLLIVCVLLYNVATSRVGRSLIAVRDHHLAAASLGVPVARVKAMAFAVAGMLGALAGALTAASVGVLTPDQFGVVRSVELIVAVVVGGVASIRGSLIGALFYVFMPYYASEITSSALSGFIFAVAIVVALFVAPRGVDGALADLVSALRGTIARRRGAGIPAAPTVPDNKRS